MSPVTAAQSATAPAGGGLAARPWRGVIEEYRASLPVTEDTPVVTLGEGGTPLLPAPALSALHGVRRLPQDRGGQPDRLVQGPRHDGRGQPGRRRAAPRPSSAPPPATPAPARPPTPPGPAWAARCWCPAGNDRAGQAGPGAGLRSPAAPGRRQLRRLPGAGAQAGHRLPGRPGQLGEPRAAARPEDGRVRDRGRARRRPGRALPAGRQRRQHRRLLAGLPGAAGRRPGQQDAADVRLPGQRRGADRQRRAGAQPGHGGHRDQDRQPGVLAAGRGGQGRVGRPDRRGDRRADPGRLPAAGQRKRACSASRPRRPAWPGCCRPVRAARCAAGRRGGVHDHRARPEGPGHRGRRPPGPRDDRRSTRAPRPPRWAWRDGCCRDLADRAGHRPRPGDQRQPRSRLRLVRPGAGPARRGDRAGDGRAAWPSRSPARARTPRARASSTWSIRAMRTAFAAPRRQPPGLALSCANAIPQGFGLGSSAGAIVRRAAGRPGAGRRRGPGRAARRGHPAPGHPDGGSPGQRGRLPGRRPDHRLGPGFWFTAGPGAGAARGEGRAADSAARHRRRALRARHAAADQRAPGPCCRPRCRTPTRRPTRPGPRCWSPR